MQRRNIQSTGGSSYFITLPKDWILRNKLKAKSALDIFQTNNNYLVITRENVNTNRSISINVDRLSDRHLEREIISYYVSGYDEIILKNKNYINVNRRIFIRKVSYKLIEFEMIEEDTNLIILKKVSKNTVDSDIYLNKIIKIIISMYEDLHSSIKLGDLELAKDIVSRDNEIDRINLLIMRRCISEISIFGIGLPNYFPLQKVYFYEHASIRLERIADHLVKIASSIIQVSPSFKIVFSSEDKRQINKTRWYLKNCQNLLLTYKKELSYKILDSLDAERNKRVVGKKKVKRHPINIIISDRLERINSYVGNIAEEMMNIFPSFISTNSL